MSLVRFLALPESFTSTLLILATIAALVPYLPPEAEFGPIKVPALPPRTRRRLRRLGPVLLLLALGLFIPIWPAEKPQPPDAKATIQVMKPTRALVRVAEPPARPVAKAAIPRSGRAERPRELHDLLVIHDAAVQFADFSVDQKPAAAMNRNQNTTTLSLPAGTHTLRAHLAGQDCTQTVRIPETSRTVIECQAAPAGGRRP
jgi:hypothetical protein